MRGAAMPFFPQEIRRQSANGNNGLLRQQLRDFSQRIVDRSQPDTQRRASKKHPVLGRPQTIGEKLRLPPETETHSPEAPPWRPAP